MKHMKLHQSFVLFVFFVVKRNIHHRVHRGHRGLRQGRAGSPSTPSRERGGSVSFPAEVPPRRSQVEGRRSFPRGSAKGSRPFSANKKAAGFLQSPSIFLLALIRGFEAHEIAPAPAILLAAADQHRQTRPGRNGCSRLRNGKCLFKGQTPKFGKGLATCDFRLAGWQVSRDGERCRVPFQWQRWRNAIPCLPAGRRSSVACPSREEARKGRPESTRDDLRRGSVEGSAER